MFHNATGHSCPNCGADHVVLNPDENDDSGHTGEWFCFTCKATGTYETTFAITTASDPDTGN